MAPLTKRSKQLLKAPPVIQNQTLIEPPIDLNISSTFSNKAVKAKKELMNKINILPEKQIFSCSKLLEIMVYPDGNHKDPVIGEEEAIRLAKEFLIPKNRIWHLPKEKYDVDCLVPTFKHGG
ncbi:10800_t:CDS:2, partial [Entrophospora sp. SA101]